MVGVFFFHGGGIIPDTAADKSWKWCAEWDMVFNPLLQICHEEKAQ